MDSFLFIIAFLYCFHGLMFALVIYRHVHNQKNMTFHVSIVVAARNEAHQILSCLQSLANIDYPSELLEIFIVDDCSEDETFSIVQNFIQDKSHFTLLKVDRELVKGNGKANALAIGINESQGDIIFTTDADCVISPQWVKHRVSHFTENVGMVSGITLIHPNKTSSVWTIFQSLDWSYLLAVGAGTMGIRKPFGCSGNNIAFRKSAYESIGGFESIDVGLTEDEALLQTLWKKGWEAVFCLDKEGIVFTQPLYSIKAFFEQRKRWTIGGSRQMGWGLWLITLTFLGHFVPFLYLFSGGSLAISLNAMTLLFLGDAALLFSLLRQIGYSHLMRFFFIHQFFYFIYATLFPFLFIFNTKVTWKERIYS